MGTPYTCGHTQGAIYTPPTHIWVHKHLATSVQTGVLIQVHKHVPAPTLVHTHLGTYMDPYTHIGSPRDPYTCGHSLHTYMGPHTCISTHTGSDTRRHTPTLIRVFIWIHTLMLVRMQTHTLRTPPYALPASTPTAPCSCPVPLHSGLPELLLLEISTLTLATATTSPLQVVPAPGQSSACRFAAEKPPDSCRQEQTPRPYPGPLRCNQRPSNLAPGALQLLFLHLG